MHERVALDRRDRHRLHVREEAEPDAGDAAEREVREPGRSAGDRVHRAELGVGEGQDDNHDSGDDPGQDGGAAHRLRGEVSAPNSQPEPMIDVSDAQVAPISPSSRLRPTSVGVVTATPAVSAAMCHPFSDRARWASHPRREIPALPDERLVCVE